MKKILLVLFCVVLLVSCQDVQGTKDIIDDVPEVVEDTPDVVDETPVVTPVIDYSKDSRVTAFDAVSYEWINYPVSGIRSVVRGIKKDKETLDKCDKDGWNYMFYDDEAVIGYEPPEGGYDVMLNAVKITVESHNLEHPDAPWDYYTNAPPPPPPPDTSHDPVLGIWQYALCIDDGTIVDGPYTAEFDFNWEAFKSGGAAIQLESYNMEHDPDAHIVWGLEKPII
jgi:hypothetical protein